MAKNGGAEGCGGPDCPSMRGRFKQTIMKNIESYDFVSAEERSFLKKRMIVKDEDGRVATGQVRSNQNYTKEEDNTLLS